MSRQCITDYLIYVATVVTRFKGRVKFWIPFNEQNFLIDIETCDNLLYKVCYNFADIHFRKTYTKKYLNNVEEYDISKILLNGDLNIIASGEPDFLSATYYMCSVVDSKGLKSNNTMNGLKGSNPYCDSNE